MSATENAMAALRDRFTVPELVHIAGQRYPDVLLEARTRRAEVLLDEAWQETPASARETSLIRALHAFYMEQEQPLPLILWEGELAP